MQLSHLLSTLPCGILCEAVGDCRIDGICSDTRRLCRGDLFIAITGLHSDGHSLIPDAIARGASAVIINADMIPWRDFLLKGNIPFACVRDTRLSEAYLFSSFCGNPQSDMKLIAVTGTNGKTTTVSMLEAIYRTAGVPCASLGTLSGSMTTPDPSVLYELLKKHRDNGVKYIFMEVSSHALALNKVAPIEFDFGIFTNLTPEHLDFHRDMFSYASAKAKLFAKSKKSIISIDGGYSDIMLCSACGDVFTCSARDEPADFTAKNITSKGIYGIEYDIRTKNRMFKIRSPIPGRFTVMNTLLAACTAYLDGIPVDIIRGALCGFSGAKGRLERLILPTSDFSVYIDFAHTPDALENILRTVRSFMPKNGRLVLLFGCGGDRDSEKRPVMGRIAARLADFLIVTSDNSRSERTENIISDILSEISGSCTYTVIPDRKAAIREAITKARPNDTIILAGKGHEEYEIMPDGIHRFSERDIATDAANEYLKIKEQL